MDLLLAFAAEEEEVDCLKLEVFVGLLNLDFAGEMIRELWSAGVLDGELASVLE